MTGSFIPKIGAQVFTENGNRAIFAGNIDGQNFVRMMLSSQDEWGAEEWPSDKLTPVAKVFETEPSTILGPATEAAKAELESLRERVREAKVELANAATRAAEIEAAVAKHPVLSTAIDFLEGRISHVVIKSYSKIEIKDLEESLQQKNDYGRVQGMKLLCLYGTDERGKKAGWLLNNYSDGSGHYTQVYPFKSLADAEAFVRDQHAAALVAWRDDEKNSSVHAFLQCPVALDWPEDFIAWRHEAEKKNAKERVAYFRQQMAPYEEILSREYLKEQER